MAKAKRVFELAKELGVKSKAIVEKCLAEDVPGITNHMSTVKVGLAETIRQWFGDAVAEITGGTAVETAKKVDLTKARTKKKATAKTATEISDSQIPDDGVAIPEDQVVTAILDEPVSETALPMETEPMPIEEVADSLDAPVIPAVPVVPDVPELPEERIETEDDPARMVAKKAKPKPRGPAGEQNVPLRPDVVKPAGEQLATPRKAEMKGPRVVRIEKPEPVELQRPRSRRPADSAAPPDTPGSVSGISRSHGPARGRGAGTGPSGPDNAADGKRRRMVNTRRGRSADALPTGPSKFSQADLDELDARLKGATGFMKQRRRDLRKREQAGHMAQAPVVTGGKVEISEPITIKGLSAATGMKTAEILKFLFRQGIMATINSTIGTEAAMEVALEYNIELEVKERETAEQLVLKGFEDREAIEVGPRPAVVTILGHVDHGKTSLLDRIRRADVAAHESGGITQHVGAYRVTVGAEDGADSKTAVFLDTPGHEAFTSMRSRGAKMTDLVVLVVAADDGVMPQTIESINHAKAAGAPIIVALNKIDVRQATEENVRKIFGQLAEQGLNPTEWGGETEVIRTSAETGEGIEDLIEVLDYQAALLELTADYRGAARGTVIETEMQPGRGGVARVLVQEGQLSVGDHINIGRAFGRVRDMTDDRGKAIKQAGPATPLELSGINQLPDAGDKFYVTESLKQAEDIASQYREAERQQMLASQTKVTLDTFAATVAAGQIKELRVVLKADVQGSVDVLRTSLEGIGNKEVAVRVLHAAVGAISESDVVLADASDAVIIGFHVAMQPAVREITEARHVDVRLYRVIYDVTDDLKKALEGLLEPEKKQEQLGIAEVKQIFRISKLGMVAGCMVAEGAIEKSAKTRIVRDGVVVTEDRAIESLRRVKDDVSQVRVGTECGIRLAGFDDIKPNDQIVCYNVIVVKRTLD